MPARVSLVRVGIGLGLYVACSSLLGLAMAMTVGGFRIVEDVWTANVLGDVVFVLGMAGVGLAAFLLAARRRQWQSVALAFIGTWAIFGASFLLTGPDMQNHNAEQGEGGSSSGTTISSFPEPSGPFDVTPQSVWEWVFTWGWPGIVWGTLAPAAAALALRLRLQGPVQVVRA